MSTLTLRLDAYEKASRKHVSTAQAEADERKHREVEPIHLFYQLVEKEALAQESLERTGISATDALVECEHAIRRLPTSTDGVAYLSPRLLELLGRAEGEAAREGGKPVSIRHLMLACAQETQGALKEVLNACGVSAPLLRATLSGQDIRSASSADDRGGERAGSPLEEFGRDLTRLAAQGRFDPTVGRDAELRRMLQVLARRRENNPLLVGEAGIGRSAIVHGLAQRIAVSDVPKMLHGKRIVALEMGALVAGAKLRGQLEERTRALIDSVVDSAGEVIIFLPDLGALLSEKGASGAGDLLATALSRGQMRAIAVAKPDVIRNHSDHELVRRFVPIPVEPPTLEEAVAVLRGVVSRFEADHGVRISDPSLVSAATFARRYVPGVQLPKSAIDLIDEAAARVRVEMDSVPESIDAIERRLEAVEIQRKSLEDDHDGESMATRKKLEAEATELKPKAESMRADWEAQLERVSVVQRLKAELSAAEREHEQARAADDSTRAGELRFGTIPLLQKQLEEAEAKLSELGVQSVRDTVTPQDVADVVAAWTGIPVSKMMEGEADKLLRMEDRLQERVIGQSDAVVAVSKAVRRGRIGLRDPKRPIGSFLFLGPTGVGKTELAKALAEFLFDDEASLTRLDMSEFMEKHMVARLLGAPPGYVDSDEGGYLTEAVRKRPYSVVLFDEMEKAHPDVFNILLQVLDDGRLTDSRGRMAHFSDTVIIMTSNVGGHAILEHEGTHEALEEKVDEQLKSHFRPEFLNRIDDTIIFHQLTKENLRGIVEIQLRGLARLLSHRRIALQVSDAAKDQLVELGYEPAFGARPLKRVILKHLQDPLAEEILKGGYEAGQTVRVDVEDGRFTFTQTSGA